MGRAASDTVKKMGNAVEPLTKDEIAQMESAVAMIWGDTPMPGWNRLCHTARIGAALHAQTQSTYVYVEPEPRLFTVGFYGPDGRWNPESDHGTREKAAERVRFLNGDTVRC